MGIVMSNGFRRGGLEGIESEYSLIPTIKSELFFFGGGGGHMTILKTFERSHLPGVFGEERCGTLLGFYHKTPSLGVRHTKTHILSSMLGQGE